MLTPAERLERILRAIEELDELSQEMPVVVEGRRDVEALRLLGVKGEVVTLGKGIPLFAFCENLSREWPSAVILTDWDRKGGQLARRLKEAFEANGARVNDTIRMELVILAKKEVKDIESLPSLVRRLQKAAERS